MQPWAALPAGKTVQNLNALLLGLIFIPFFLLAAVFGAKSGGAFFAILFPVFYAIAGFIGGIIEAAIYNMVAQWTGGLEFEVQDVPPAIS